jgi:hypothetical protein
MDNLNNKRKPKGEVKCNGADAETIQQRREKPVLARLLFPWTQLAFRRDLNSQPDT